MTASWLDSHINEESIIGHLQCQISEEQIPTSRYFSLLLKKHKFKKFQFISNGDDYQVLFTASKKKSRIIKRTSKILGIKITKIGKIISRNKRALIYNQKGKQILIKNKGYIHQF